MTELKLLKERIIRSPFVRILAFAPKAVINAFQNHRYAQSKWSKDMRRFKGIHSGETCFVVGNGPSLTISDLEKINGQYTFCSNYIYRLFDKTSFRPTYYVAADPLFFPEGFSELSAYEGISDYFVAPREEIDDGRIHKINVSGPFKIVKGSLKNDDFSEDVDKYLALSYTVTYYSLQLAVYMGFKTIYLIGVDHEYSNAIDENGRMSSTRSRRSYSEDIDPDNKPAWNFVDSTTYSYITARKYADTHGVKILNATRGGSLEVFERVELENIV